MYACTYVYVLLRARYECKVYTLYRKKSAKGRQTHTERKNVRTASLIGSKLAKINWKSWKLDRVEKIRYIPWSFRAKISNDVSLTNSRAPGMCFVIVAWCNWFWPNSGQVYLILAKTLFFSLPSRGRMSGKWANVRTHRHHQTRRGGVWMPSPPQK